MQFQAVGDQHQVITKLLGQSVGAITCRGQSAATLWCVRTERGDHRNPIRCEGPKKSGLVGKSIVLIGQEMENRAVVPYVPRMTLHEVQAI